MDAKLTLKLDKMVIDRAKEYAKKHQRSLSRMIESYLRSLTASKDSSSIDGIEISSFVKSMSTGVNIPSDLDYKKEYANYLDEKYKWSLDSFSMRT